MRRTLETEDLSAEGGVTLLLSRLDEKAGLDKDHERKTAYRQMFFELKRKASESMGDYARRRARDFSRAAEFSLTMPAEAKGLMLLEGAQLDSTLEQSLLSLTAGSRDFELVLKAMISWIPARIGWCRRTGGAVLIEPTWQTPMRSQSQRASRMMRKCKCYWRCSMRPMWARTQRMTR